MGCNQLPPYGAPFGGCTSPPPLAFIADTPDSSARMCAIARVDDSTPMREDGTYSCDCRYFGSMHQHQHQHQHLHLHLHLHLHFHLHLHPRLHLAPWIFVNFFNKNFELKLYGVSNHHNLNNT